jgi:hypothetical protein
LEKCPTYKKVYLTESIAEEALISAWITYNYAQGSGPINIYICEDCGYYHLTSKGPMNKKLEEQIASGKIHQKKGENAWLDKLKHKRKR